MAAGSDSSARAGRMLMYDRVLMVRAAGVLVVFSCLWRLAHVAAHVSKARLRLNLGTAVRSSALLPVLLTTRVLNYLHSHWTNARLFLNSSLPGNNHVIANSFPSISDFDRLLHRIGEAGPRLTGNKAHEELIDWIEAELRRLPGLEVSSDTIDIQRWQPKDDASLKQIAKLEINGVDIQVAGAVPFSRPASKQSGELLYVAERTALEAQAVKGKIVLREFPSKPIPYVLGMVPSYSRTSDLNADILSTYDRPGLADQPLHEDLLAAGDAEAAGIIFMFDLPTEQVQSYFDPHKGTHYKLPAVYVGAKEAAILKQKATQGGCRGAISIDAQILPGTTRNVTATLPGQIKDRIVYVTHTDGNTYIQENGPVAILALARYFSSMPLSSRRHTLQFTFNSGHLHISKEGTYKHATEIDESFDADQNPVSLIIPTEHLGAREIEAVPNDDGRPGRRLVFTGRNEVMFWCTGPSPSVVHAVKSAIKRRKLDRVLLTRGVSTPNFGQVPTFTSFGGIGTYYHNLLLPTTSLVSGPWSLWAPYFGREAVDVKRLRDQTLALGDVACAVDHLDRAVIHGGYTTYRHMKSSGKKEAANWTMPPEFASDLDPVDKSDVSGKGAIVY